MVLHVFDETLTYIGRVESWLNLAWTEQYCGEGGFALHCYDTDRYARLLRRGYCYYRTDRPCAMLAVKVERDTEKGTITVNGYSALHLLDRRVITLPEEYTNVEDAVLTMVAQHTEELPNITAGQSQGLEKECELEVQGQSLLSAVLEAMNQSEYGIRCRLDIVQKMHVVEVYEGTDQTFQQGSGGTVFSQEFGSLKSLVVTEDDDLYKNVAYVTGADNSSSETIYYQYVSPEAGPKANWREVIITGDNQEEGQSSAKWRASQKQKAIDELEKRKNGLCFQVDVTRGGFGTKYDLGTKVTCKSKRYGLQFDVRITEYKYEDRNGLVSETLTIGEKPLGYVEGAMIRNG